MPGPPSQRPSLHSASGEPSLRRLGVGSSGSDRPVRAQIVASVARCLELTPADVNLKATTTEKLGFLGRAEGLAAQAVVLIGR